MEQAMELLGLNNVPLDDLPFDGCSWRDVSTHW